jgi:hypothetical protein
MILAIVPDCLFSPVSAMDTRPFGMNHPTSQVSDPSSSSSGRLKTTFVSKI